MTDTGRVKVQDVDLRNARPSHLLYERGTCNFKILYNEEVKQPATIYLVFICDFIGKNLVYDFVLLYEVYFSRVINTFVVSTRQSSLLTVYGHL